VQTDHIMEQLDKMVAAGRVTAEEAARLRATAGTSGFDEALASIRARHAQAHTDRAVEAGRLTEEEADGYLARVRDGEHSRELRSAIKGRPSGA
jgi:polyhydroxyalkanoate synthesis regulator phasin